MTFNAVVVAVAVQACLSQATLLAVGSLETCQDDGVSTTCEDKFHLSLSVQNGQDATESVSAFLFDTAFDESGTEYDIDDIIAIELSKSVVSIQYPLHYTRQYNNKPYEIIRTQDKGGTDFHWLLNRCQDGLSPEAACGAYHDPSTTEAVPYSQGFCCRCDLEDYISLDGVQISRAGLDCDLFSTDSMAAHCMRYDALWYSAFELGAATVSYTISVAVERCNRFDVSSCVYEHARLSPASPGACIRFPDDPPDACTVSVALEGDFAAFEDPPPIQDKLLFVPTVCDDLAVCAPRLEDPATRWMLLDRHLVTTGSECNKVGVAHEAFYSQGERCAKHTGTCLEYQLEDYYQQDLATEALGQVPSYFASAFGEFSQSLPDFDAGVAYTTDRFQKTVVSMSIVANAVQFTKNVAPAAIRAVHTQPFESLTKHGSMDVHVVNVGTINADFSVEILCSVEIVQAPAQPVSLAAPPSADAEKIVTFSLQAQVFDARLYYCLVSVKDSNHVETDSHLANFTTTATILDRGSQGGVLDDDAPTTSDGVGDGTSECSEECPSKLNLLCAALNPFKCMDRVLTSVGIIAALAVLGALASTWPGFFCAPCSLLSRLLCCRGGSKSGRTRRRRRRYHTDSDGSRSRRQRRRRRHHRRRSPDSDANGTSSEEVREAASV